MLESSWFLNVLRESRISFFTGVPDSLLKHFCAYVNDHVPDDDHIIAANEGGAVALAAGHHLATGNLALVYMQNSGQGNAVNPLASLADPDVYGIPMLLLVGWRGEPGLPDEPQHVKQGRITLKLLETLGIGYGILPQDPAGAADVIRTSVSSAREKSAPRAIVVRNGTFSPYSVQRLASNPYQLSREDAIRTIVDRLAPHDVVVSTTGKISRELFEYRVAKGQNPGQDFLTVGSMGHASQIALRIALDRPDRQVFCFDGDGAMLMHLGSLAIIGSRKPENFKHVLFNNGAHDSVGGQSTVGFNVDFSAMARACGYRCAHQADSEEQVGAAMQEASLATGPVLVEIRVRRGARSNLGRPTSSPIQNKKDFCLHTQNAPQDARFEPGAIHQMKDVLDTLHAEAVFLVTGNASYSSSGAQLSLDRLAGDYRIHRFSGFSPNPKLEDVEFGVRKCREFQPDVVVAIGGGSVIDMAKLIALFAGQDCAPLDIVRQGCEIQSNALPIVAVPTTAGSGSEATHFAVLYVDGRKSSVEHPSLLPQVAIVDPELTYRLPALTTAVCGMDALCQAVESYWSVNSTEVSRQFARESIRLTLDNLVPCVHSPTPRARGAMCKAAHLAGKAIALTKTTAPHAISYTITSRFGVPHGLAVALTLGEMLIFNGSVTDEDVTDPRGVESVRQSVHEICRLLGCTDTREGSNRLNAFMAQMGLPTRLGQVGIRSDDSLQLVCRNVNMQRLANNPRKLTPDALDSLLRRVA